ncbi:hypothetical protein HJG60_012239 [Phyllostomus discolor]|uniref:Uncharacterized protein n=1 Tax=Phyllostomus discolor TaxID=89673 RepID=A0A833ZDX4_9CHIR|nr:hypothetical protein HJG60_012239 [Phyllostomus discolor]
MRQLGGTSRASCALYPARVPASWNLGSMTSPQEKPPRSIQAPRDCGVSIRWPGSSQDFPHHPENAWPSRWRGTENVQHMCGDTRTQQGEITRICVYGGSRPSPQLS